MQALARFHRSSSTPAIVANINPNTTKLLWPLLRLPRASGSTSRNKTPSCAAVQGERRADEGFGPNVARAHPSSAARYVAALSSRQVTLPARSERKLKGANAAATSGLNGIGRGQLWGWRR